ncbi:hypothetical protein BDF20DRAFT_989641 [Mycotypha africana]|uniref:uncharacterized protein n=1 Tax=Mycotypha africana TaxID=64632 RepID=UPI002301E010|nr:uncharacterized protein BDF20DRAFT_989641 [Mycotypha africana]KAI8973717.1 hypothetical protein BDF20DRAFT_989641 [Mycotypha africana]
MSFAIPGYFHDLKTNKYYKITPSGPFSLPELRKRLQREKEKEEEDQRAALAAKEKVKVCNRYSPSTTIPKNIIDYLQQRKINGGSLSSFFGGANLLKLMAKRSSVRLCDPVATYEPLFVQLTQGFDSYGEFFLAGGRLLQRFGYQLEPQFQVWQKEGPQNRSLINGLGRSNRIIKVEGLPCQSVFVAEETQLTCLDYLMATSLLAEEIQQYLPSAESGAARDNQEIIRGTISSQHQPIRARAFKPKRDMLWSVSCNDNAGGSQSIITGGDRAIYMLNSEIRLTRLWKVKSSVFALCMGFNNHEYGNNNYWVGHRDGKIRFQDIRLKYMSSYTVRESSSICQIQALNENEIVTIAMNGDIAVWDKRQMKDQQQQRQPLQQLKGYIDNNNINRSLGFDVDPVNQLVAASGIDGHVRIWSLSKPDPIWVSKKYKRVVPALKLFTNPDKYPRIEEGWSSILPDGLITSRKIPGLLLFGASEKRDEPFSIDWFTSLK